jgi:radical SAM superfamily enzyme YgiQ (UPF0313 family)
LCSFPFIRGYFIRLIMPRRSVILVQLPIPPVGPQPIRGNVPLAAGYLKLFARLHGLESSFDIELFPPRDANTLGDQGLVEAILRLDPWMIGFTCYLWNIERTLWIAQRIKQRRPDIRILIGGPEVTLDNAWVLADMAINYAIIGEGEQTFADLLSALLGRDEIDAPIPGLMISVLNRKRCASEAATLSHHPLTPSPAHPFIPRRPLPNLNEISSPYLAGILDAADEQMLLLETIRGCIFKCKFCYYPKSYDDLYFVAEEKIVANLDHAQRRGAKEVVLLDPTLNQRRNFPEFLRLLARCNPDRQFTYFGELRAEGITPEVARLLHEAGFDEVEIGLQSIDPLAMQLMDRHNNLRAFERGARAMLDLGIKVKVDLIIGLPGDTVDSVRRGIEYVRNSGLYSQVQVFNLAVLPGTSFRQEAEQLGLVYQDRPPYYVLETPTLSTEQMYDLMAEAEDAFETEFDPLPEPQLLDAACKAGDGIAGESPHRLATTLRIDLDNDDNPTLPSAANRAQAFTLWLRSSDFTSHRKRAVEYVDQILTANPFTTLQIVLEPLVEPSPLGRGQGEGAELRAASISASITAEFYESILRAAFRHPTYLDRFYSVQPGRTKGAKRLIVALLPDASRPDEKWPSPDSPSPEWLADIEEIATVVTLNDPRTAVVG